MIQLSNGHCFEYMAASGALAFNGKGWPWEWPLRKVGLLDPSLFTVVIKTLTYEPRRGNLRWYWPFGCIRFLPRFINCRGTLNSVGLTNPGIKWWCRKIGPTVNSQKIPLVGSILSDNIDELVLMAAMLNYFDLIALEFNASCPNVPEDLLGNTQFMIDGCRAVRKRSRFPLILKLSVVHDIKTILPAVKDLVEAISINSVPWVVIFPHKESPLVHLGGGGVSGKIAQLHTWAFAKRIRSLTSIPVIWPSIWDFSDIEELRQRRVKAISFGSIFLRYPWRPTLFVRRDKKSHPNSS